MESLDRGLDRESALVLRKFLSILVTRRRALIAASPWFRQQKDAHFASTLQQTLDTAAGSSPPRSEGNQVLVFTLPTPFKPDGVLSLYSAVALYDTAYRRHPNVFRLVAPAGRQYLFQAHDSDDMNSWLHAINYAASFKSANMRVRPLQPPVLRSSTNSVPPSPALSTHSIQSFRPPSQMTMAQSVSSTLSIPQFGGNSLAPPESLSLESRGDSNATIRPFDKSAAGATGLEGREGDALVRNVPLLAVKSTSKPLPDLPRSTPIVNSRADILRVSSLPPEPFIVAAQSY